MKIVGFNSHKHYINDIKSNDDEEFDDDLEEEYIEDEMAEEAIQLIVNSLSDSVGKDMLLNLKQYLARGIDKELFNRMVYLSWDVNNNKETPYEKDGCGNMVAPVSFWREIEVIAKEQIDNRKQKRMGY